MPQKYNQYRRATTRLQGYDYGQNGAYFVTICTKNRISYFGDIVASTQGITFLQPTEIGNITNNNWLAIPEHFPFVSLDAFIIMPDHLHGIIIIEKQESGDPAVATQNFASLRLDVAYKNKFGPQSKNLASIIRGFKASVKSYATKMNIEFVWQSRYYDRIIRDTEELQRIRHYIENNPQNWFLKKGRDENLFLQ